MELCGDLIDRIHENINAAQQLQDNLIDEQQDVPVRSLSSNGKAEEAKTSASTPPPPSSTSTDSRYTIYICSIL